MSRYFFNVRGSVLLLDRIGSVCSGEPGARVQASEMALLLLAEGDRVGDDRRSWVIDVCDDAGRLAFSRTLSEAIVAMEPARLRTG